MARSKDKLTKQQEVFVEELVKGQSQRQAYRQAYSQSEKWKDKSVDERASKLFANVKVKSRYNELLQKVKEELEKECIVEVKDVVRELKKIGFADITDFLRFKTEKQVIGYDVNGTPVVDYSKIVEIKDSEEVDGRVIQEVTVKNGAFTFKLHDKMNALNKLGKYLGMFTDKIEISGEVNNPFSDLTTEELKELIKNE